jgi:hypothetical protein
MPLQPQNSPLGAFLAALGEEGIDSILIGLPVLERTLRLARRLKNFKAASTGSKGVSPKRSRK